MGLRIPRMTVAGLSGDSGKTVVSLSLLTAFREKGQSVSVFKKGPDYIDAAWLSAVAGSSCRNLDTFMVDPPRVLDRFVRSAGGSDVALIEGNRGVYDGRDVSGTHSTAALAKLLGSPILLVVDATKATRTLAAVVRGCQSFDPDVSFAGVILNRVAGRRHEKIISEAIREYCGLPILGVIPKLGESADILPGRHLGLVTPAEFGSLDKLWKNLATIAEDCLDVDRILELATEAPALDAPALETGAKVDKTVRIAFFKDSIFTFYYPENLEALESCGAELVPLSSIDDGALPADVDALYIGGGFPETQVERLTANRDMMDSVRVAADSGLPIYAECGGLIYLSRSLAAGDRVHPMSGVFPIDLKMSAKPAGHGYTELKVEKRNPFFEQGTVLRGHEFHYTGPDNQQAPGGCLRVITGVGLGNGRDGLVHKSTLACYTHIHADGVKEWAPAMVAAASDYRKLRSSDRSVRGATDAAGTDPGSRDVEPGSFGHVVAGRVEAVWT